MWACSRQGPEGCAEVLVGVFGSGEHPGALRNGGSTQAGAVLVFEQCRVSVGVEARGGAQALKQFEGERGGRPGVLHLEGRQEGGEPDETSQTGRQPPRPPRP
jgi:hypothetical protein